MSYDAEGFANLHGPCVAAGHVPVAYVYAAARRPGGASSAGVPVVVGGILESMPPGVDLLLPRTSDGLACALVGYEPDVAVCDGFPWRVPAAALRVPRLGMLNVHPSLLPRHRGPMPIHWAVRQGDAETGVTIHWMAESFDTGRIVVQRAGIRLEDDMDGWRLFDEVQAVTRELLPRALELAAGGFLGEPQDEADASYEAVMGPDTAVIDWSSTVREVHNLVRAYRFGLFPVPGPLAQLDGKWVSVLRTRTEPGDGAPMECADGPLWIVESIPVPPRDVWLPTG
jgi:methionyl-tRNA formyltransferase